MEEYSKATINQIARTAGHVAGIKKMMEAGRSHYDVLTQLSAVKAEITSLSKRIMKERLQEDIERAIQSGDEAAIAELSAAIDTLL